MNPFAERLSDIDYTSPALLIRSPDGSVTLTELSGEFRQLLDTAQRNPPSLLAHTSLTYNSVISVDWRHWTVLNTNSVRLNTVSPELLNLDWSPSNHPDYPGCELLFTELHVNFAWL